MDWPSFAAGVGFGAVLVVASLTLAIAAAMRHLPTYDPADADSRSSTGPTGCRGSGEKGD